MQHISEEQTRIPDTSDLPQTSVTKRKWPAARRYSLRLSLYLVRSAVLLAVTSILFAYGVNIIHQQAYALGFFALNFDVPLPFMLIGLWGVTVLALACLALASLLKVTALLARQRRLRPLRLARRQAA